MQRIVPLSSLRGRRLLVVFHRPRPREGEGRPPCPFLPSRVLDNSSLALKKAEPARQADCYLEDSARFDGQNLANANRTQRNSSSDPACVASVSPGPKGGGGPWSPGALKFMLWSPESYHFTDWSPDSFLAVERGAEFPDCIDS